MDKSSKREKAVVLLSGGMDSCVCAALAARDYDAAALHVMYGQRTEERERRAFERVCDRLGIRRRMIIRNEALRQIGGSALTDESIEVPRAAGEFEGRDPEAVGEGAHGGKNRHTVRSSPGEGAGAYGTQRNSHAGEGAGAYGTQESSHAGEGAGACDTQRNSHADEGAGAYSTQRNSHADEGAGAYGTEKNSHADEGAGAYGTQRNSRAGESAGAASEIPITYVPFRNAHFLAAAVSWAEVLGAGKILIGAVEQDSSGYPDCRPQYYRAFNEVIRAGTKEGNIEIVTPLIGMRKAEIVRLGLELGAPFDLTWSCYSREDRACGVCESCVLRLRAFEAAGAQDPIAYESVRHRQ